MASPAPSQRPKGGYIPSVAPAAAALAVWASLTIAFLLTIFWRYRRISSRWIWGLPFATALTSLGFILRIVVHGNPYSTGLYIVETLCILLAPVWIFWAGAYRLIGRLGAALGEDACKGALLIKPRWFSRIFVTSDILGFLIQGAGGGLSATDGNADTGHAILLAGLALQLASLSVFFALSAIFGYRMRKSHPQVWAPTPGVPDWRILLGTMLLATVGFLVRSAYRVAEYSGGYFSMLATTESYFYALDSIPLALACSLYLLVWPPYYVAAQQERFDIELKEHSPSFRGDTQQEGLIRA